MILPVFNRVDGAQDEERNAAERMLTDMLIEAAPNPDALALRRVLAGWLSRRD
jgi:hypothetical protein